VVKYQFIMQELLGSEQDEPSLRFFNYQGLEEGTLEYQEALDIENMIQGGMDTILMLQEYMDRIGFLSKDKRYSGIKSMQDLKKYRGLSPAYKDLRVLMREYFGESPADYLKSKIEKDYKQKTGSFRNSTYFATVNPDDAIFTHRFEVEAHTPFIQEGYNKIAPSRLRMRMARIQKEGNHFKSIDFAGIRMDILTITPDRHLLVYDLEYDYGDSRDNVVGKFFSSVADILIAHYHGDIDVNVSDFTTGIFQLQIEIAEEMTGFKFSEDPIVLLNYIKNNSKYHIDTNKRYPLQSDSSYRILFAHMDDVELRVISEKQRLHIEEERSKIKRDSKYSKPRRPQWDDDE
jgi:hypothetical protein